MAVVRLLWRLSDSWELWFWSGNLDDKSGVWFGGANERIARGTVWLVGLEWRFYLYYLVEYQDLPGANIYPPY